MQRMTRTSYRRGLLIAWRLLRQVLGWFFILLGLLGLVLPVLQGVLFLVIGVALVGRRNWLIRRSMLVFKRFLRRWAAVRSPLVGGAGRIALRAQWKYSRESRHLHRRYAEWRQRRATSSMEMEEIAE
jgi:hypothetical protein